MTAGRVVVVGGGLAGITAAIDLRDAGMDVTLLESRPRLGGAATSYGRAGLMIDNGQHVFLRCCDRYQGLLARLGVSDLVTIQERFDVTVLSPAGPARLRRDALPSPLHLARALLRYRLLSIAERARVGRAALAFRLADPASPDLDQERLGGWLAARGQSERARRRLWDLFIVSALNIDGDEASVGLAATVIKTALLGARDAADIGMAKVPLGRLHAEATAAELARVGVHVRLGARAASIKPMTAGGFQVNLSRDAQTEADQPSGQSIGCDAIVLAVPADQAARLATTAGVTHAAAWPDLGYSPILNAHVVYDRRVMDLPFAAGVDSPIQWVFDKTSQAGVQSGQYLAVSISAADDLIDVPTADLQKAVPARAGAAVPGRG